MRWVGFVRNVMIGREGLHRAVLLRLIEEAGGNDGRSHLATGNVTFTANVRDIATVVRRLEQGIESVIGRHEPVITRRFSWLQEFVSADLFGGYEDGQWELLVALLPADAAPLDPARLDEPGRTVILQVREHELIGARPIDQKAPHVNGLAQRAAGIKTTSRGWSTLQRISRA
jgi:uncharacterized protein (DUF1697 family)